MSTALGLARRVPRKLAVAVMWLWVLFGVFIYVWVILGSVKTNKEIFIVPWGLPTLPLQWGNFATAWASSQLGTAFINSILIVGVSTGVIVGLEGQPVPWTPEHG
jgi:ABC-type glycerol-3-phosphate transport system permease component